MCYTERIIGLWNKTVPEGENSDRLCVLKKYKPRPHGQPGQTPKNRKKARIPVGRGHLPY